MTNRSYALLTGVFLVVLSVAIIVAALWMSGAHHDTRPFLVVTTQDVSGLQPQSTILYRGIRAGTVSRIRLDPRDPRNILIDIDVDKGIPVTSATFAKLKLQGITGLSLLELDYDGGGPPGQPLATSEQAPAQIPMRPSLLDTLGDSGAKLALQLQKLAESLNELLDADNRGHVKRLLAQAEVATTKLTQLEADLDVTARSLPALGRQSQATLLAVQQAATNMSDLGKTLDRELSSGTLGQEGTLQRLNTTLSQIDQAAGDIHVLARGLAVDPQRLLYGPAQPSPGPGEAGYREPPR